jgi:uncharacterized membrane protein YdjX (TVP38/TMEM64 family)
MRPNTGTVLAGDNFEGVLDFILNITALIESDLVIGLLMFVVTALLISMWVPGFVIPLAASSGVLLNSWWGAAPVILGSVVGSIVIFFSVRRFGRERVPGKVVAFMTGLEPGEGLRGLLSVIVLRLIGAPHFLVSAGYALTPMGTRPFAIATALGMMPAILMAAAVGSSLV